jgi:hypothetical protein
MSKLLSLLSSFAIVANLLTVGIVSADIETYLPDFSIFYDYQNEYFINYTSFNDTDEYVGGIPLGGTGDATPGEGDELYIGSSEPFSGLEIEVSESNADGEYTLYYFQSGSNDWKAIDDAVWDSLEGTISIDWDYSDWYWAETDVDSWWDATDPDDSSFETVTGYFVKLETTHYSEEDGYAWASSIYLESDDSISVSEVSVTNEDGEITVVDSPSFSDVVAYHDNYAAIEYLVNIGTLEGYSDGTFQPENTVNRAELMKILVAGQEITPDEDTYNNCFPDVTTEWFAPYVCYAAEEGWVDGYPDGTFQPGNTVNRVEAMKMVINALGFDSMLSDDVNVYFFTDVDDDQWYSPYVYLAKSLGLLESTSGLFNPSNGMTRASVSENVFRGWVLNQMGQIAYDGDLRDEFFLAIGFEITEEYAPFDDLVISASWASQNITIYNADEDTINLSGFTLRTYNDTFYTFGSTSLSPGESVVVDMYFSEEWLYIYDADGVLVDTSDYTL